MRFFRLMLFLLLVPLKMLGQQNILDSLKHELTEADTDTEKSVLLVYLSKYSQDRQQALDYALQSVPLAGSNEALSSAFNQVAWSYKNLFQFDSAVAFVAKALAYAQLTENAISISDVYNTYGSIFYNQSMFDSAIFYHKKALKSREDAKDLEGQAISLNNISIAFQRLAMYDQAEECINKSLLIYEQLKFPKRIADTYLNKGNLKVAAADLDGAYESFQQALKSYESLGLDVMMTYALINMGEVAVKLNDVERAKRNYWRSINILKTNGEIANLMAFAYGGMGAIYDDYDIQPDSALYYNQATLNYANQSGNVYLQSIAHNNLGSLYLNKGFYNLAEKSYKTAEKLKTEIGDKAGLSLALAGLGKLSGLKGAFGRAENYFVKAMKIAAEVGDIDNTQTILLYQYEMNKLKGDFKAALANYEKMDLLKDSLLNAEHMNKVAQLNIQYDTEKKEQQIELQDARIAGQEVRLERNQALIIGLILTALLLVVIVLLIRNRANKERMLLKRENELKLREAEINAVINSQEKERHRFARDLHDGFGQMISVLKMNLGQLGDGRNNPEKQLAVFEQSEQVIGEMYSELRNICFDLMPHTLVEHGVSAALKEFGERVNGGHHTVMEVLIFDLDERLSELIEVSLYRISQEWVNNILKYSEANQITLQLTRDEQELTLTIEDNGKGFDPDDFYEGKGNGWRNIQTRVNLIKGTFELDSRKGVPGTLMSVNVPLVYADKIPTGTEQEIAV